MTTRPSRNMRFYWRMMLVAQFVVCVCGLGQLVLGIIGVGLVQGSLGGVLFVLGGVGLALRGRQYRKLTPEQLDQTIPEHRRTKFRLRWPEEEARLKPPKDSAS